MAGNAQPDICGYGIALQSLGLLYRDADFLENTFSGIYYSSTYTQTA